MPASAEPPDPPRHPVPARASPANSPNTAARTAATPPRVLWVTNDLPPRSGGIEQFLGNLLARSDPATTLVLASQQPGAGDYDVSLPYEVRRIARRPMLPTPALLRTVRTHARSFRADVVLFGAAWPLAELASGLRLPAVALSHGHEAGMVRVGGGPAIRRASRAVDWWGVISGFTRRCLAPWLARETRVFRLSPGVDTELFTATVDGTAIRRRHGLDFDQPVVVCIARLVPRKGQDALVEAWPRILRRVPDAGLLLIGDGPLRRRLTARAGALGMRGSITFVGEVPWAELPAHHAAGDVFAMPCRTRWNGLDVEGLGIAYLEAQACGRPVVAGRSGGAPEALIDGASGVVVDGRSPSDVAGAISGLLSDPQRRRRMGEQGRAFVEANYAWPRITHILAGVLRTAAAGRD